MATTAEKILKELANMEARMNERFATKEDLIGFATKDDLNRFATREDLKTYATKADLDTLKNDIMTKLDTISGTFQDTDEMLIVLGARTNEHGTTINKIKQKLGMK